MSRRRRAYHPELPEAGATLQLSAEESHHLLRVLRLRAGDRVDVFDGLGAERRSVIREIDGGVVTVTVGAAATEPVEPPLRLHLFQALIKPDKLEWVLQKGTEIGFYAFHLVRTEHAEPPRGRSREDRWRRVLREACKQSGRRRVPDLHPPIDRLPRVRPQVAAFVLDPSADQPLGRRLRGAAAAAVWLAAGPEGGFDPEELAAACAAGWRAVRLGPRVLRAETAGAVAAAIVLDHWGDLGR